MRTDISKIAIDPFGPSRPGAPLRCADGSERDAFAAQPDFAGVLRFETVELGLRRRQIDAVREALRLGCYYVSSSQLADCLLEKHGWGEPISSVSD